MYTLYIDTHDKELVFVLLLDGEVYAQKRYEGSKHSLYAIDLLNALFLENKVTVDQVKEIIVINGPGSFTGVRIGCVIAKVMAYTKHIPLKALTYLQALSLSYNENIILGIADKNGVFGGEFTKDHVLKNDYFYISNQNVEKKRIKIVLDGVIDFRQVYNYMQKQEAIHPHLLKPIYVKKIEVENG